VGNVHPIFPVFSGGRFVVSLKASWQAQKKQRQQELAERQHQVRESLNSYQQERRAKAAELRHDLKLFQQDLQQETQGFLIDVSLDRQVRSERVSLRLREFSQALQQQTADFLDVTAADRALMSQELAQDLSEFHIGLSHSVAFLRKDLQSQIQQLRSDTQTFLQDCQQQRVRTQIQLMQDLESYIESLQGQVSTYLVELDLEHQERSQQVGQMLKESREFRLAETAILFQQLSKFRDELREYCHHLHETVWGDSTPSPQVSLPPAAALTPSVNPSVNPSAKPKATRKKVPVAPPPVEPVAPPAKPLDTVSAYVSFDQETASSLSQTLGLPKEEDPAGKLIFDYIQKNKGARLTEIQSALGINRSQTVDGLRALIKQGLITQRDRIYLVQEDISL
jgi:gas vesicle GvpC-like protein